MLDTKFGMKYPFPHTLVHIVDNSAYTGELPVIVADDPSMYGTLVVSGFPMGEDRRVIRVTRSDILNVAFGLNRIGTSEIKKYGQTITYPLSLIEQGAPVQLLRVTPDNATYAYSCITIEWRWDKDTQLMHVRYGVERLPNDRDLVNYQNKDRLAAAIKKAVKSDDEDSGWHRRAFMINIGAGRGSAYNAITTAINQTVQSKRPANAQYLFTTIDTSTNLVVEQFLASLVNINNHRTDAIDPVNIVVGKRAEGSSIVVPYVNEDAIQELYNDYRAHYEEMNNDSSNTFSDYETDVLKTLTINTFDPIFGLYLYGGTDVNAKLPFFQVDMRSADLPELPEAQRVYYVEDENKDLKVSEKVLNLTTGITNPTDKVHIGDVYLYGGITSSNNPYIYIVTGINQYSGAVTTVRTKMLRFKWNEKNIDGTTKLATIIETDDVNEFYKQLNDRLTKGYVADMESVAWVSTSDNKTTWELYYVTNGSVQKAKDGVYVDQVKNDQANMLPAYSDHQDQNPGYSFIAWDEISNVGNLVAVYNNSVLAFDSTAATRAGATGFDIAKPFDDSTTSNGSVWVNSGYYNGDDMIRYVVADRTISTVKKYGTPPSETILDAKDVVGTQFDAFLCSEDDADAYTIKDDTEISITSTDPIPDAILGWKPENANLFRFQVSTVDGSQIMKEITDSEISKTYYNTLTASSSFFVALKIVPVWCSEYQLTEEQPGDWTGAYTTYSTRTGDSDAFIPVAGVAPAWDNDKYYFTTETGGTALHGAGDKPADWDTTYSTYYVATTEEGERTLVAGVAPAWAAGKYYSHEASANFYLDRTLSATNKVDTSAQGADWNAYKDGFTAKYYKLASGTFTEIEDLTSESQIIRWYKELANGQWTIDESIPDGAQCMGGFSITIPNTDFEYIKDARAAAQINRFTVIGTIGSLYRIQENAVSPPADYYSSSYGYNITSENGGIPLADGYTGFFDESDSDIEYKWNYSVLMVNAFRGNIDPRIMSPVRVPAKYLFDGGWNTVVGQSSLPTLTYTAADLIAASTIFTDEEKDEVMYNPDLVAGWSAKNSDIDVKQAMYDLMEYRVYQGIPEDKRPIGPGSGMSLHLDAGVTDASMANTINNSFVKRFDNPNASFDIGGWVSSTDGLAYTYIKRLVDNMFRHCQNYSVNKPFVNTYTKIDRSEYVSYFPDIDTTDWDYRATLYNSGGNVWIPDVNGAIMRRSQRTLMRSSDTSDLLQESNMRTLTQLVYLLQNKLDDKLFEYNDDSVLRTMQDEVNNMFTNWVGNLVEGLDIHFERDINPNDGGELVVCYVDVVFRGINLRIPIIVNVNRRLTTT